MNVKIFKPNKNAMQSGRANEKKWCLESESCTDRTPEPLMGWSSANSTQEQIRLKFDSKEEAIAFAEKQGWSYTLSPEHKRQVKPRNYVDNFRYVPPKKQENA